MIYLALGDSITYGLDATDDDEHYVRKLKKKLNERQRTSLYVHAKPGWTASQLLKSLERIPPCIIEEAGLVSVFIGGNDLIKALPWFLNDRDKALARLRASFLPPVQEIVRQVKLNSEAMILLCSQYNPFPQSELAEFAVVGLNEMLAKIAREEGCLLVPVHKYYGGKESDFVHRYRRGALEDFRLLRNPIHPNNLGHTQIADAIFDAVNGAVGNHDNRTRALGKRRKVYRRHRHRERKRV